MGTVIIFSNENKPVNNKFFYAVLHLPYRIPFFSAEAFSSFDLHFEFLPDLKKF